MSTCILGLEQICKIFGFNQNFDFFDLFDFRPDIPPLTISSFYITSTSASKFSNELVAIFNIEVNDLVILLKF